MIRSWNYFDKSKICTIKRWEDPRITGKQSVIRIPVPPLQPNGREGRSPQSPLFPKSVILPAYTGPSVLHTDHRLPSHELIKQVPLVKVLSPPSTPKAQGQIFIGRDTKPPVTIPTGDTFPTASYSPYLPHLAYLAGFVAVHSFCFHFDCIIDTLSLKPPLPPGKLFSERDSPTTEPYSHSRPISLVFSPHGIQL